VSNGEAAPALPAIRAEMKMTPIVGEMNASDMPIALGSPRAFRLSWLVSGPAGWTSADMLEPPEETRPGS